MIMSLVYSKKYVQKIYRFIIGFSLGLAVGIAINALLIREYSFAYYLGPNIAYISALLLYQLCAITIVNCVEYNVGIPYMFILLFWGILIGAIAINKEQRLKILLLLFLIFGFSSWVTFSIRNLF